MFFFGPNLPKKGISGQKQKSEHHLDFYYITRISIGIKFQLKVRILIFGPNFAKTGISSLKQKNHAFALSMVNTFYIKLFCIRTSRHNIILMFLLLLVAGTISPKKSYEIIFLIKLGNLNCGPFIPKYKSSPEIGLH